MIKDPLQDKYSWLIQDMIIFSAGAVFGYLLKIFVK
jgi:hypothetical protein